MNCAACVRRVESTLEKVAGIKSASVNLATSKATLVHDSPPPSSVNSEKPCRTPDINFLEWWTRSPKIHLELARHKELTDLKIKLVFRLYYYGLVHIGNNAHLFLSLEISS